jgi:CheY-like chemotaxis protein
MPDMSGVSLARIIRGRLHDMQVLFISGYAERHELDEIEAEDDPLLAKPFSANALLSAMESAVTGHSGISREVGGSHRLP